VTATNDNVGMDEVLDAALEEESGSGLKNERLQFFFRHQPMIRTWQALAPEAWREVAATLRSLYEDLAGGTSVPDGFSLLRSLPDRDAHGPVLYREDWCLTDPAVPDLAWVLWWDKAPDPSGSWGSRPYSGLLPTGTETGKRLRPLLKPMVKERLRRQDPVDAGFEPGDWFSVFRYATSSERWYESIPEWRQNVLDQFLAGAVSWASFGSEGVLRLRASNAG